MSIMKKTQKLSFLFAVSLMLLFTISCNGPKKLFESTKEVTFRGEPEVLEVHGDSIEIKFTGRYPKKSFPKKGFIKLQPVIVYGENGEEELPLKPSYLMGEGAEEGTIKATKIKYATGGSFTYVDKIPFDSTLLKTFISLDYNIKFDNKFEELDQCLSGNKENIITGTIATSQSVKPTDDLLNAVDLTKDYIESKYVFYFALNEGNLRDSVKRGPITRSLVNYLKENPRYKISGAVLNSYASPDGEARRNEVLTSERANSGLEFIKGVLSDNGSLELADNSATRSPDPMIEDWKGLAELVENSNLSDKNNIIDICNSSDPAETKERSLRNTKSWNVLKRSYLPKLRRVEITLKMIVDPRPFEELQNFDKANQLDSLNKKELLSYANAVTTNEDKARLYKEYAKRYPEDWAGLNNYAVIQLKDGNVNEAEQILASLNEKFPENDTIANNYGVVLRHSKRYNESKELYMQAQRSGIAEANNLGILYIKYGDYSKAVSSFEANRCDYNVALALTLAGDYEKALSKIECIEDKTADVYYLKAIVGARNGDKDLMTTALTRAVTMDASIKEKALKDLEFRKHNNTAYFKQAIKQE